MIIVVAIGSNDIEVPCLWFWEKTAAVQYMKSAASLLSEAGYSFAMDDEKGVLSVDDIYDEYAEAIDNFWKKFFTGYSNSCGGVTSLELRNVPQSTPFVGFDLD